MTSAKFAAAAHWGIHPCGAAAASEAEEGSARFFDLIDTDRYQRYAPWLPEIARFERFAGQDLLEIGCGLGTDLARFARAGAHVTGIDLVPRHLALTRQRFQLLGIDARLVLADAERLPYPDASFDAVYSFGVLHHTPGIGSAIAEIRRVLRPGGRAIVAVYNLFSLNLALGFLLRPMRDHLFREPLSRTLARIEGVGDEGPVPLVRFYSEPQLRRLLRGFRSVEVQRRHLTDPLGLVPQRILDRAAPWLGWYLWAEGERA